MLKNEKELNGKESEVAMDETLQNTNKQILGQGRREKDGSIFFRRVLSGVIDQIITIALSTIILLVLNFILKLVGFYIVEREQTFFILYVLINVLYVPICKNSKLEETIGTKINFRK